MRPDDAEPLSIGGGRAHGIGARAIGILVVVGGALRRADVPEGRLNLWATRTRQALASRPPDRQDGKALLDVAAHGLKMHGGNGLNSGSARGIEVSELDQVVGQLAALIAGPGRECREQRPLVDQAVLEGQQAEKQIARRVGRFGTCCGSQSIQ